MRIQDCTEISGITLITLDHDLPNTSWRKLVIEGSEYDPIIPMDIGSQCVAVAGTYDFTGREITFL
jgi:hypothetical protein